MKQIFIVFALFLLGSCGKEYQQRNQYLPEVHFKHTINLNLANYNKLFTPLNYVIIPEIGIKGVIVVNSGLGFFAWDLACPNLPVSDCSKMEIVDNLIVKCPCDGVNYNTINGAPTTINGKKHNGNEQYPMLNYRVQKNGNFLIIEN